ncbi:trypsin beta-like [Anticarsia gemmatalis]|uniref:trypsin beta-like n=1 Tax=Anticarsia gemmatalis TaxID=129554 RepID=UPI003F766790
MVSVVYLLLALVAAASAAPESRVVGGTPTTIEEFPYAISILYRYPMAGITIQRCVGSLISSFHVLTSGFCFTGAILSNMQIRAGSTSSMTGGTLVAVSGFEKHPTYSETPRAGDIAVLFLARALGMSNTINVLFLPPAFFNIPDGTSLKVVSWGFESEQGPQMELLKEGYFNKMNVFECQNKFSGLEDQVTITEDVICAQAPGKAICRGNSGAGMVINNVIIGTSSYHQTCTDEYPSVFARVDRYTNWILEVAAAGPSGDGIRSAPATL